MGYQALYRVWRPHRFDELIGQKHVTRTLQNAIRLQKLSHAYLFTGPRGTGKTTAARIVAKAMNCERAPVNEPCNECAICLSITDGSNPDIIEIDAASYRGIDHIRDLRDKVKYAPSQAKIKVYIIDEVHMLSTEAFNALLKTLEEPPRHVMFILATTEPHKLPTTIISRCQRFDFKPISSQEMVDRMQMITEREGIEADPYALFLIARAAEGGMRDALSILDQVISFSENRVTVDDVLAVTDTVSETMLFKIATACFDQNVEEALQIVQEVINQGKDPVRFLEDLMFYLRDVLLYQTAPALADVQERASRYDEFRTFAEKAPKQWIYSVIETLNDSQQQMKWTTNKRIFLEVAFVKICHVQQQPNDEWFEKLQNRIEQLASELQHLKKEQMNSQRISPQLQVKDDRIPLPSQNKQQLFTRIEDMLKTASKQKLSQLQKMWGMVMETIRKEKISAHAWLKDSRPVACSDDAFLLAFPYEMHSQMASKDQIRSIVERAVESVCKKRLNLLTIVEEDWEKIKRAFVANQQKKEKQPNEEKESDPLISEAKRLFGEELIEFK